MSRKPGRTIEKRENQLIALAFDLVEKRLREGTATSQETTHFLKLGSTKEKLEREMMEGQKKLLTAKTENLQSSQKTEGALQKVLEALASYRGQDIDEEFDEDDEDEDL